LRRDSDFALGRQAAAFAAAGLDPGSGSALLAQQSLAGEAELEALQIRNAGLLRAQSLSSSAGLTAFRGRSQAQRTYAAIGDTYVRRIGLGLLDEQRGRKS
jgi:hypothetical protein